MRVNNVNDPEHESQKISLTTTREAHFNPQESLRIARTRLSVVSSWIQVPRAVGTAVSEKVAQLAFS